MGSTDHALPAASRRTSGCPVHFVWDGRGAGRWPVRLSFWLTCGVAAVLLGARTLHVGVPDALAQGALGVLGVAYALGQLLSLWDRLRPR